MSSIALAPAHTSSTASIEPTPTAQALKSAHAVIIIGHRRHVNVLLDTLIRDLPKVALLDVASMNRDDVPRTIAHMAFEHHKEGYETLVVTGFPPNEPCLTQTMNALDRNMSVFGLETDIDLFADRHGLKADERKTLRTEVMTFNRDARTFFPFADKACPGKFDLIYGMRREAAQIDTIISKVQGRLGKKQRPFS